MNESVIIQKLIQVGQMLERGELEYSGAEIDTKHFLEQYVALRQPAVSGRSEQLHLCPVCDEKAGKSYLLSKLPTICQKCDHAWNRA